ncbi:Cyclic nucleotide-binding protein [Pseudocohnilembus persalinus]|uniref:Amine oxidase n=1 Tax=Pseudocohnilembus persalinus TaxID=266149 RepID=A0A0V0QFP0_PSEPJ|nr:Cyclic nucleotide-binding protein [Pseudocohnilembus persalinus]|eukprot:KRX00952.1 Cyclic nucleotide-binding protein [Pseudocohnilembus persalinus]
MSKSVIIIGGGLSGLTAADEILQKNKQIKITVLEANDRVGGRSWSEEAQGAWFDNGGQWVGPHQKHVLSLAKRANSEFITQNRQGKKVLELNSKISYYKSDIPNKVNILALIEMQLLINKINKWAKQVPKDEPYKCKDAAYWDSQTVDSFIQQKVYFKDVRQLVEIGVRAVFGTEPSEISMLFFLWYTHQSEGFENLVETKGNQEKKIVGGSQSLSKFLVKEIEKRQGQVKLNKMVTQVIQDEKNVTVITQDGDKYYADYIIIAMPPVLTQRIHFTPQLSYDKELICQKNFMGSITKTSLFYKTEFWKEKGFCGETASTCKNHPVINIFEDSRPKSNGEVQPSLVVFSNGSITKFWQKKPIQEYHDIIKKTIYKWFQSEEALDPIQMKTTNWGDQEFNRGGPVGNFPPGVLSMLEKPLFANEGRIHWAGTEMAVEGQGFLDGAVQSGVRAANEILDRYEGKFKVLNTQSSEEITQDDEIFEILKQPINERSNQDLKRFLDKYKEINLFEDIRKQHGEQRMLDLCQQIKYQHVEKGQPLFYQGDKGSQFFIILKGEVGIYHHVYKKRENVEFQEDQNFQQAVENFQNLILHDEIEVQNQDQSENLAGLKKSSSLFSGRLSTLKTDRIYSKTNKQFDKQQKPDKYEHYDIDKLTDKELLEQIYVKYLKFIVNFEQGKQFGQLAIESKARRAATVIATEDSDLAVIDSKTYNNFLCGQQSEKLFQQNIDIFQDIDMEEFSGIFSFFNLKQYKYGQTVYEENEIGDGFYIINSGEFEVLKNEEIVDKKSAQYFGQDPISMKSLDICHLKNYSGKSHKQLKQVTFKSAQR